MKVYREVSDEDGVCYSVLRELACLQAIRGGPYIVALRELVHEARGPTLVLEWVPMTLSDRFKKSSAKSPSELRLCATLIGQLASGVAHMHGLGYLHRDIKPANCLVHGLCDDAPQPSVRLADFGGARVGLGTGLRVISRVSCRACAWLTLERHRQSTNAEHRTLHTCRPT